MSRNIVLADGQDGYEAVSKYVIEYWENVCYATVLVTLETSCNGKDYRRTNEIVSPYEWRCEYLHDWWEGEPYIKILGIKDVEDINILSTSDTVEVVRCKDCQFCEYDYCKHPNQMDKCVHPTHYCSYGERREG